MANSLGGGIGDKKTGTAMDFFVDAKWLTNYLLDK
jgi:hypothetical protein